MSANPPAGRRHVAASPTAIVKAGSLCHELQCHAFDRATHFFYFVVTMKMVVHELNRLGGAGAPHAFSKWVSIKATDQIGSGLRSDDSAYSDFVRTDPKMVDAPTTHFTRSDAAHFCNLGLKAGLDSACQANAFTRDGYQRLKVYAGNTMQLPQLINIGPDRKIDVLHGELAIEMLDDDQLIFTRERVKTYQQLAVERISDYQGNKARSGASGLAACAGCYLKAYEDADFSGRVYRQVYPEIIGLCQASDGLKGQAHLFFN
ncbi:MAG: hypothetical protein ABI564_11835 [Ideonella sp.]